MTKGRKTTFEERVEIVQYCIKHSHNYSETAKKFHISYQQARSYTIRYEENGVDGLQDKRGKRKSPEEMTEVEKLRAEVRLLRAEKRRAEIEISFLKKLEVFTSISIFYGYTHVFATGYPAGFRFIRFS